MNNPCISTYQISRTEPYRSKMDVVTQRKAINNSTFRNESDIGKAVSDWTCNYNNSHGNITRNSLHNELMYLLT